MNKGNKVLLTKPQIMNRAKLRKIADNARTERDRLYRLKCDSFSAPLPDDNRPLSERLAEFDNRTSAEH